MQAKTSTESKEDKNDRRKPDHEMRVGLVRAAVWINATEQGFDSHSVVFSRLYKNDQGQWRSTTKNWGRHDLFSLTECIRMVHVWIANRGMRNQSCSISTSTPDSDTRF